MVFQEGMRKLEGFPAAFFFWAFHLQVPLNVLVLFELQVSLCPSTTPGTDAASASSRPLVHLAKASLWPVACRTTFLESCFV